jgi:NTE family protein
VLIVGLRHARAAEEEDRLARGRELSYSTPTYLVGKALNALLLDRVEYDVDRLRLFNEILETGQRVYGPEFLERINEAVVRHRNAPFRIVGELMLRPSQDLGNIAAECLHHQKRRRGLRDWLSQQVVRYAGHGTLGEADLLSYLFFDRCYADHLIELGRRDAKAAEEKLAAFLDEVGVTDGRGSG